MGAKILYLPGAQEQQLANRIVELGNLIKQDIVRCLRYKERQNQVDIQDSRKAYLLMNKCKKRLLSRLEKVATMQSEFRKSDEEWQDVLKKALEKADKNSPDFQKKLDILLAIFMNDTTSTKVNSVISFMEIVARVPENHVSIPFHK